MQTDSHCRFTDHQTISKLKNKRLLGAFVNELIVHFTGKENRLQYIFVNDGFLHQMNLQYLQHDTYTDIITFDLSEKKTKQIDGEIYISTDRVLENSSLMNVPYIHELYRVIIHGALHLCGFKDKTKSQQLQMRALENEWLQKYLTSQKDKRIFI